MLHREVCGGPGAGAPEAPLSLETPGESEQCRRHTLTSSPGSEPLLDVLSCASSSAIPSASSSAKTSVSSVLHQYASPLHVSRSSSSSSVDEELCPPHMQIEMQSLSKLVTTSNSSSSNSADEELSSLHVPYDAQSPPTPVSILSTVSSSSVDEELSPLRAQFNALSPPAPVSITRSSSSSSNNDEVYQVHVQFHAQSPSEPVSVLSSSSSSSADEELSLIHVQFDAQSPPGPISTSSSSSSSSDDEKLSITQARHPNGLWRYVIVFAALIVNLIGDGIILNFGLFFPDFLDYFGERKQKARRIAEIFMAMPLLSGPIASFLIDRYGCRRMTIFGSFLAALGFIISAFVDNMETFMFTYVIMAGFGLSLCYVAAVVIIAYYFEYKCALATGFSMCGSGIGTLLFAPLIDYCLNKYGWRGTTIILAGLLLNMVVCGLLFRDLPWMITMNEERLKERQRRRERKRHKRLGSSTDSMNGTAGSTKATDAVDIEAGTTSVVPQYSSLVDLPTYMTGGEGVSLEIFELMSTRGHAYGVSAQNQPGPSRSFSDSGRLHEMPSPKSLMSPGTTSRSNMPPNISVPTATEIDETRQLNDNTALSLLITSQKQKEWYSGLCWELTIDILDFSLFLNPAFLVFAMSNFLLHMWYSMPHMYISDNNLGMTFAEYSTLTSSMSLINIFSEILFGWIGSCECASPIQVYAVCMILCGLVTIIMPLLTTYVGLGIASRAFSIFVAANYSLTSVILVEQVTLKKFTKAYGLLLFMNGLVSFIVPPLTEWIFEITSNYDLLCYLAGGFMGLSGLILIVLPLYNAARRCNNHHKPRATDPSANILTNKSGSIYEMHSMSNTQT